MRIGVMLRSIDEKQGIGIYSKNIVEELLRIDRKNEYTLFYWNRENLGLYSKYDNVEEKYVYAPNKLFWDQVAIPYVARKCGIDLIFHTKFTVPLFTKSKTIMVLHGYNWFDPQSNRMYKKHDVFYVKVAMPMYCKKADYLISVSELTTRSFIDILGVNPDKIKTVYFGPNRVFRRIRENEVLEKVKSKYNLPDRFILTVIKYAPHKNFDTVFKAFQKCRERTPCKLVVVGRECWRYREDYKMNALGLGDDVFFPGWVEQEDLPAFYNLADLYLYPSLIEAFPIPLCEAMACGCPIVTTNATGLLEIAGNAAILVDPMDVEAIADAVHEVLMDGNLRQSLAEKGLERAERFSWERCARETLEIIENVATN